MTILPAVKTPSNRGGRSNIIKESMLIVYIAAYIVGALITSVVFGAVGIESDEGILLGVVFWPIGLMFLIMRGAFRSGKRLADSIRDYSENRRLEQRKKREREQSFVRIG